MDTSECKNNTKNGTPIMSPHSLAAHWYPFMSSHTQVINHGFRSDQLNVIKIKCW